MSDSAPTEWCPVYAPFFGVMGCTASIVFTCFGAAYGTAKSGVGISALAVMRPELMMKNVVPVVMVRYLITSHRLFLTISLTCHSFI